MAQPHIVMLDRSDDRPLTARQQRGAVLVAAPPRGPLLVCSLRPIQGSRFRQVCCSALLVLVLLLTACATPYVQAPGSRASAASLNGDHAIMDDGYRLPLSRWQAEGNPRAIVLGVHGMNDYSNSFDSTGRYLSKHNITLIAPDQRGFGGTQGHGLWHGAERLAQDIHVMTRLLRERYPDQRLYLLGESMGGAVVLATLSPEPPDIDGMILIAPAVWARSSMPYYQRLLLWLAAHTVPGKQLTGEGLDIKASDNIEMLRALGRDPMVIKATRVDVLYGVSNLMDNAQLASSEFDGDTLILYGKNDEVIPKQPTCEWLQSLPADALDSTRTLIYENGYHMLTRDLQADTVLSDIADWLLAADKQGLAEKNATDRMHIRSFCVH